MNSTNHSNLFYYTVVVKSQHEDEVDIDYLNGNSFNLSDVLMTSRPKNDPEKLEVILRHNFEEIVPVDYKYEPYINPQTKKKEMRPVKATKFEVVSQPVTVILTLKDDIERFFKVTSAHFLPRENAF
jgi:hypothetical protein